MKKKVKNIILLVTAIILIYIIGTAINIWCFAEVDETRKADVIIVLGAAAYDSGPSPVYRERLNHAIQLYNDGYSEYIVVTGGCVDGNKYSDAYIGKQYLLEKGIPDERIIMEDRSVITEENFEYSKRLLEDNGFESALIVSDPLHMKRAMYLCERSGIEGYSSPTKTSMYRSNHTKIEFLFRELFYYIGYRIVDIV